MGEPVDRDEPNRDESGPGRAEIADKARSEPRPSEQLDDPLDEIEPEPGSPARTPEEVAQAWEQTPSMGGEAPTS